MKTMVKITSLKIIWDCEKTCKNKLISAVYCSTHQMGTNYKAALIPQRIRETMHGWGKAARRKRRHHHHHRMYDDSTTVHTDASTVLSVEEDDDHHSLDSPRKSYAGIELQHPIIVTEDPCMNANEASSHAVTPLIQHCASISFTDPPRFLPEVIARSSSMPIRRELEKDWMPGESWKLEWFPLILLYFHRLLL